MPRLSRRTLLVGGAAAAALPTGWIASRATAPREEVVIGYLRHLLPGLAVPDNDMQAFAKTYVGQLDPQNKRQTYFNLMFAVMANPALEGSLFSRARSAYEHVTRSMLTTFLMSTDFFSTAAQQPARTSYVAYSDPFDLGCRNPLARFDT